MSILTRQFQHASTKTSVDYMRYVNSECKQPSSQFPFNLIKRRDCSQQRTPPSNSFDNFSTVSENQRKIEQIHKEVRRCIIGSQENTYLENLTSNKSLIEVKCQSKRLNDFVQRNQSDSHRDPLRNLLSNEKLGNKFHQIEKDLDANMLKIKQGFSQLNTLESDTSKQFTQRKGDKECTCKANQAIRKCLSQCTQPASHQHSVTNDQYGTQEKRKHHQRRPSNSSFQCTEREPVSYMNTATQTKPARDYKKKYKDMVDKVRTNELIYLDLKKQNMRLISENDNLKQAFQTMVEEKGDQDIFVAKLRKNMEEMSKVYDQQCTQNSFLASQLREYERQLELKDVELENYNLTISESKKQLANAIQEIGALKRQQVQFEDVERHIQEIEQLYISTLDRVQSQVKKQKGLTTLVRQTAFNLIRVSECFRESSELPLQALVQHRHTVQTKTYKQEPDESDLLFSDRSSDGEQIHQLQQRNTETLQSILKTLCSYLDQLAERQIHKLGDLFTYAQ